MRTLGFLLLGLGEKKGGKIFQCRKKGGKGRPVNTVLPKS